MTTLISARTVTARKPHPCATCGAAAIEPGQTYSRQVYAYDGRIYTWVQCLPCEGIALDVHEWAYSPDEGVGVDEYTDWADQASGSDPRADAYLARLRPSKPTTTEETQ